MREKLIKLFSRDNEKSESTSKQSLDKEFDESLRNRELLKAELFREMEKRKRNKLKIIGF